MRKVVLCVAVALFAASVASAGTWAEVGDADNLLPGQETVGAGALDTITGLVESPDVDLFRINIVDYANFSASTVGLVTWDTRLFLFDTDGYGVAMCDDEDAGSSLQSTITSQFLTGNGTYILAIGRYSTMAQDAAAADIWLSYPYGEKTPDGAGAANPLAQWNLTTSTAGEYTIALTGAEYSVPEPASLLLLAVAGLVLRRR